MFGTHVRRVLVLALGLMLTAVVVPEQPRASAAPACRMLAADPGW